MGQVGVPFTAPAPTIIGGITPYTFSVATGSVPNGLTYSTSTGAVSGTPTTVGSFSLKVTDGATPPDVGSNTCSYSINACLLQNLGAADVFAVLGLQGAQVNVQQSSGGGPVGLGAGATLHVQGNSVLTANVFKDPTATIQINGGASLVGTTTTESFTAIQNAVAAAAAAFAALTPTQTFSQQINSATTINGNGGQNVILINNGINLNNGANLTISGGSSDNFVFNIAQGQNIQLQNGSSIVLSGVSPSQVVFNFLGNGGNVQVQSNNQGTSNTAGIFLDPLGQINIQGGTHNSVFISGKQIQLQNAQVIVPTCGARLRR